MLATLIAFWRAHKSRSRITAAIEPHLTRWRQEGGTDAELDTPVALGFLTTLITAQAQREAGGLGSDALGNLQAEVWHALTGLPADTLGERIVELSVADDPNFARGCRAALVFDSLLSGLRQEGIDGLGPTASEDELERPLRPQSAADLAAFWNRALSGDIASPPLSEIS